MGMGMGIVYKTNKGMQRWLRRERQHRQSRALCG